MMRSFTPILAAVALALPLSACGGLRANDAQADGAGPADSPTATVVATTAPPATTTVPSTAAPTSATELEQAEDTAPDSLPMTADEIAELEAELDAIDSLLTELDASFDQD